MNKLISFGWTNNWTIIYFSDCELSNEFVKGEKLMNSVQCRLAVTWSTTNTWMRKTWARFFLPLFIVLYFSFQIVLLFVLGAVLFPLFITASAILCLLRTRDNFALLLNVLNQSKTTLFNNKYWLKKFASLLRRNFYWYFYYEFQPLQSGRNFKNKQVLFYHKKIRISVLTIWSLVFLLQLIIEKKNHFSYILCKYFKILNNPFYLKLFFIYLKE